MFIPRLYESMELLGDEATNLLGLIAEMRSDGSNSVFYSEIYLKKKINRYGGKRSLNKSLYRLENAGLIDVNHIDDRGWRKAGQDCIPYRKDRFERKITLTDLGETVCSIYQFSD
jgi:hypothetical protein